MWSPPVSYVIALFYYGFHNSGKVVIYQPSYAVTVFDISPRYLCRDVINPKIYWFYTRLRDLPIEAQGFLGALGL